MVKIISSTTVISVSALALPDFRVAAVVIPVQKVHEGVLIQSVSAVWFEVVRRYKLDPATFHEIPPRVWEEIVAGAYVQEGFDEVMLTPRSGDGGKDVIAIRHGIGSIRILDQVKAYSPGNPVTADEVRAVLHVMSNDRQASKAAVTTTGTFAPKIWTDPTIAPYLPTRLELRAGDDLRAWLSELESKKK